MPLSQDVGELKSLSQTRKKNTTQNVTGLKQLLRSFLTLPRITNQKNKLFVLQIQFFLNLFYLCYLKARITERGRERGVFPFADLLLKWLLWPELGRSKTGSRSFFQVPYMDAGTQGSYAVFPGHMQGAGDCKRSRQDWNLYTYWFQAPQTEAQPSMSQL